jgi:hypothetical protein
MNTKHARLIVVLALVAAVAVGGLAAVEQKSPKPDEASLWMTRKLQHSQEILAALTRADFAAMAKGGEAMLVLSYLEKWDRADMPEYKRQVKYFDDANKELIRHARAKNLNGATLAYTQLMQSCVQCHTVIRDAKKK